jgi:hypothetical protein
MPFEMKESGPPVDDARIDALERSLGIMLPPDYRAFLKQHNGGRPDPRFFPVQGWPNRFPGRPDQEYGGVHYFHGIDEPITSSNLDWNFRILRGRIPDELLPIAGDESGNEICLSMWGSNRGHVYIWDHDGEHSPPTYANIYLIAKSFPEFLESLHFRDPLAE